MSGRRYDVFGKMKGLRGLKVFKQPLPRLRAQPILAPPVPVSVNDLKQMFKLLGQMQLKADVVYRSPALPLPSIAGFSLICKPPTLVLLSRELYFPKPVSFWLPRCWAFDKTMEELSADAESYEDYRVRQFEEAVLYGKPEGYAAIIDSARRKRGKALALDIRIQELGAGVWYVPSSGAGGPRQRNIRPYAPGYKVDMYKGTCECPDYKGRKQKCKHIYAVEYLEAQQRVWKTMSVGEWLVGTGPGGLHVLTALRAKRSRHVLADARHAERAYE